MKKSLIMFLIVTLSICFIVSLSSCSATFENSYPGGIQKESVHEHNEIFSDEIPATCTTIGYTMSRYCSLCGEVFEERQIIPALGHNYNVNRVVNATCVNEGYTVYVCERCGDEQADNFTPLAEHIWGEWEVIEAATCTEAGTEERVCENDDSHRETRDIPALGHNFIDNVCSKCGYEEHVYTPTSDEYFIFTLFGDDTYAIRSIDDIDLPSEVVIPSTHNGKAVTMIEVCAFCDCSSLNSIVIPDSVTIIESDAFTGCSGLERIIVSEKNSTFKSENDCLIERATNTIVAGCKNSIIPNSVTSIGSSAFSHCSSLTSIEIPNSVTSIGDYAFDYCSSLTSIEIPNSVTNIEWGAFFGCGNLISVLISDSVTIIKRDAFGKCWSLESIIVDEKNPKYKSENNCLIETATNTLILGCKNSIIPNSVTSIGDYAFEYCSSLMSIVIPNSVISIGYNAFYGCSSLYYVTNKSNLGFTFGGKDNGYIAYYAKVIEDKNGHVLYNNDSVCIVDDFIFGYASGGCRLIAYLGNEETITLPLNCNGEPYSIYEMKGVKNVIIPQNVESIGDWAFSGCSSLTSIEIPNSVTCIGGSAFSGCSSLTSIEIPSSVTSIGLRAFEGCSSLTSIEIPSSVSSIGKYAFLGCSSLTNIEIPSCVTSIDLSGCSNLTSIDIPSGVTSISFSGCSSLTSIDIPSGVTSIEVGAFYNCRSLTSIDIPSGVTSIGAFAFEDCSSLTSIFIPDSVMSIGGGAFRKCWNLESIIVDEKNPKYKSESNCLLEKETNTLIAVCKNSIMPSSVTNIGERAFLSCSKLTNIEIPNSVTNIGSEAFRDCYNLTSIVIPDSVISIGKIAFFCCYNLTNINYNGTKEQWQTISKGDYWNDYVPSTCKVYCTDGTISIDEA